MGIYHWVCINLAYVIAKLRKQQLYNLLNDDRMKKLTFALILTLGSFMALQAQTESTEEFKPSGKMDGRVFANFNSSVGMDEDAKNYGSAFKIERAYWGYTYQLAPEFSARVLLDIGDDSEVDNINRYAFFKNAYVAYSKNNLKLTFGIQSTFSMNAQEKVWDRRYVEKTFLDLNKFSNTADLGFSMVYDLDVISFDLAIFNGEGFKFTQKDNSYQTSAGVTANLLDDALVLRANDEYLEVDSASLNKITLFAGYINDAFSLGVEYNSISDFGNVKDDDRSGISAFGAYNLSKKTAIFGRYDIFQAPENESKEYSYLIGGIEYKFAKNFRASLNLKNKDYKAKGVDSETFAFLSLDAKF